MNNEIFSRIIDEYINHFDFINNDEHREYGKWIYFKEYKDNFDINAEDFGAMFKKSIKGASFLVNNSFVCPTNGIVYFAQKPETKERVRDMFKDLYADDGGDIKVRQNKIEKFRDDFNNMLEEYEPNKWKYKQEFRSALLYLTLYNPDENYLFKSTQAKKFREYIQFGNDFGTGSDFNLKAYYDMCNAVVDKIKEIPQLVQIHKNRLKDNMYQDENYTLLTFDIIFSAYTYGLYNGIEYKQPPKMTKAEREAYAKTLELTTQLAQTQTELDKTAETLEELQDISINHMKVQNKKYGNGVVINQNGTAITIEFADRIMKFEFPTAVISGLLSVDDDSIVDCFKTRLELEKKMDKLTRLANSYKTRINNNEIRKKA